MPLKIPNSIEECLYFTNRSIGEGKVSAWVYRKLCPKCKKAKMGKPVDKGSIKIRADKYVCLECGYEEDKATYEATVKLEAVYTCPKCGKEGEYVGEYKRKKYKGVDSYILECRHCQEKILLTKKLKGI